VDPASLGALVGLAGVCRTDLWANIWDVASRQFNVHCADSLVTLAKASSAVLPDAVAERLVDELRDCLADSGRGKVWFPVSHAALVMELLGEVVSALHVAGKQSVLLRSVSASTLCDILATLDKLTQPLSDRDFSKFHQGLLHITSALCVSVESRVLSTLLCFFSGHHSAYVVDLVRECCEHPASMSLTEISRPPPLALESPGFTQQVFCGSSQYLVDCFKLESKSPQSHAWPACRAACKVLSACLSSFSVSAVIDFVAPHDSRAVGTEVGFQAEAVLAPAVGAGAGTSMRTDPGARFAWIGGRSSTWVMSVVGALQTTLVQLGRRDVDGPHLATFITFSTLMGSKCDPDTIKLLGQDVIESPDELRRVLLGAGLSGLDVVALIDLLISHGAVSHALQLLVEVLTLWKVAKSRCEAYVEAIASACAEPALSAQVFPKVLYFNYNTCLFLNLWCLVTRCHACRFCFRCSRGRS
jgi:hypothetical protein